ncbi:MAG TPA: tripartite tricarboxylate transporter TctB family protein [Nocardioides sp.]|nr:tripartite tricarboxylate transporter TctB family protein [Nocardioides sp.]
MSTDSSLADGAGHRPAPFRPDLLAGSTFILFGLAFAIGGSRYDVGSALRMGSGYVPLALGSLLVVLGLLIMVMAFRGGDPAIRDVVRPPVPWRRGGLLVAAILFFGFFVSGLGLGPTLFVTTFIAAMAGHGTSPLKAALTAAGITALCLVVFVALLQLRLPVLGEWLGG